MLNTIGDTKDNNIADGIHCSFLFVVYIVYTAFYHLIINISDVN
jgi:hypothetical protein